jgi:hypothetical protein
LAQALAGLVSKRPWFANNENVLHYVIDGLRRGSLHLEAHPRAVILRGPYGGCGILDFGIYLLCRAEDLEGQSPFRVASGQNSSPKKGDRFLIYRPNLPQDLGTIKSLEDLRQTGALVEAEHIQQAISLARESRKPK